MQEYLALLERKKITVSQSGFIPSELNPLLFPFQAFIVTKALKAGRYAIFADCGLGKTIMQLEFAQQVVNYTGKPVIILAPLAVIGQTIQEGQKFGYEVIEYLQEMNTMHETPAGIFIANYEQLENLPTEDFAGVILDESSILKNDEGATKGDIIESFAQTPYKLACTATPSPNDLMELGNHSEFLNVMSRAEMLAMYFLHDGGETSKWRLKGHSERIFWQWVNTWGVMLSKPSDIGFSDAGYVLPDPNYINIEIKTPKRDNGKLFNDVSVNATNYNQELRITLIDRLQYVAELINQSEDLFLVSVKQNEESAQLCKMIPCAVEVKGSDSPEYKRDKLLGFAKDQFRVLVTKKKIVQFGMNYQNCHNVVDASPDFSFEGLYQFIRRCLRYGQKQRVNIYIVTTDTMANVIESINRKHKQFIEMQQAMQDSMNEGFRDNEAIIGECAKVEAEEYTLIKGDCVQELANIPDESIGFSIFSPPFADLYTYSDKLEDMGNSRDYNEFLEAFRFLVKDLFRVLWSGRNVAVHCMDLPIQKGKEGYIGLRDFSGMILQAFNDAGFIYHSRVTIWKNPVTEMQRTKALGLLHKQVKKDAAMSRVGIPDYLLVFRKPGDHNNPVRCDIPVDLWQQYASPVWMDIDYGNTLNAREGRADKDEKHICPLQLETIERAIHLWTNKGDKVLSPFAGIGSEVYQAVLMDRYGVGIELKDSYFSTAVKNLESATKQKQQSSLF